MALFGQFLISSCFRKGHEPSRAENPSAQLEPITGIGELQEADKKGFVDTGPKSTSAGNEDNTGWTQWIFDRLRL